MCSYSNIKHQTVLQSGRVSSCFSFSRGCSIDGSTSPTHPQLNALPLDTGEAACVCESCLTCRLSVQVLQSAFPSSAQGSLESKLKDRMEPKVQVAAESCGRREQRHPGSRVSRRTSAFSCRDLPNPSPHQPEKHSPKLEADSQRASDSDTDLSESERLPESPSVGVVHRGSPVTIPPPRSA